MLIPQVTQQIARRNELRLTVTTLEYRLGKKWFFLMSFQICRKRFSGRN